MSYTVIITEEDTANITVDETTQNITVDTSSFPITIEYNATTLTPNASPYGNADVTALMANFGSNAISTTGTVTTGNVIGNGSGLSAITGANVTGTVANATFALTANTATFANTATIANTANAVAGANVSGTVANATYALNANTASFANTATVANSANAVAGANVSGTVANATYALNANTASFANTATIANSANAVAGANVTGTVANATYAASSGSATTATTAGTVTTAAQGNITSVGTLSSLSVSGNVAAGGVLTDNYRYANGTPISFSGTYGNANVVSLMGAFGSNAISTSGNVTAGNITVTTDAVVQGNLTVSGNTTFINSNVVTINDKFINVANNAVSAASANGGGIGVGPAGAEYARLEYLSTPNVWSTNIGVSVTGNVEAGNVLIGDLLGAGNVTATGNVTGAYIQGNGSALSNITGANVTGTVANATYAVSSGSATTAGTVTSAAQANITSVGTLSSLSVSGNTTTGNLLTGGVVSATGNITGNYILGNGSQLTGLPATYGNADVVSLLAAFGSNSISTTGNVTAGAVIAPTVYTSNITGAAGQTVTITAEGTNDIHLDADSIRIGDNNTDVTVVTHGTGDLILRTHEGDASQGNIRLYDGVSGNIDINPNGSGTVNVAANLIATGNVTGNYFIGNGSQLTGITTSAGGSNTQIQFNNGGVFAGNTAMTFETVTGNVGLGNLIIGSGNTASVGAGQRINTAAAHTGVLSNATNYGNAQIVIGNGYFGNMNFTNTAYATGVRGGKVMLWDSANVSDAGNIGVRYSGLQVSQQMLFTSNIANVNNSSFNGTSGILAVGGGASGNSFASISPATLFGVGGFVFVGQSSTAVALGNTTVGMAAGVASRLQVYANSAVTTAVVGNFGTGQNGNITNNLGLSVQFNNGSTGGFIPSRVYGLYMGGATATVGAVNNSNTARSSGEYYFLRNDDPVAQTQLGTLRSYNEFNSVSATTSGALTIDKAVSQVHQVNLTGNITSVTYANMVSSLSDSVNTDEEVDTVTIIFNQGATGGYTVALPTGATYKYAGGGNTVTTTANSVTLVAVTVARIGGTATYLTTVSPGFI